MSSPDGIGDITAYKDECFFVTDIIYSGHQPYRMEYAIVDLLHMDGRRVSTHGLYVNSKFKLAEPGTYGTA